MRCYEFYCAHILNPVFCADKSDSMISRINQYIEFMKGKGVKFNKSPEDKELFLKLQEGEGSEFKVTQPKVAVLQGNIKTPDIIHEGECECTSPSVVDPAFRLEQQAAQGPPLDPTQYPLVCHECKIATRYNKESYKQHLGQWYCPNCYPKVVDRKALPPVEVKVFKPKETAEYRRALMKPQHSQFELDLYMDCVQAGLKPELDVEFCIQRTIPDQTYRDRKVTFYFDGPVHEGKEEKDDLIRQRLQERHDVRVVSIPYVANTREERERVLGVIKSEVAENKM